MGIDQFLDCAVIPHIRQAYPQVRDLEDIVTVGDPAGNIRAPTDESTCYDSLRARGFRPEEGETNDLLPRLDAVRGFLTRLSGGKPALLVSSECPTLRKGLAGKYRFKRIQVTGEERYHDAPVKDMYSHPQDALQYVAMKCRGGLEIRPKRTPEANRKWAAMGARGSM